MMQDYQFEIDFCQSLLNRGGKDVRVMEMFAGYLTRSGRIDEGLEVDRQIVDIDPENPISHYNLACSLALKNRRREALDSLRTALERGYEDFAWMMKDEDLKNLHSDPGFSTLISEFQV